MKTSLCFILTLLFLTNCQQAKSQSVQDILLTNRQPVLNGRAYFDLPENAVNTTEPTDIMAEPGQNTETKFVLDIDSMRIIFMAQELYLFADSTLFETISNENGQQFETKVLTNQDSLFSVLSIPKKMDSTKPAILINSVIVKTQDNSIFRFSAYISQEAYEQVKAFQMLSQKVFHTLSKGYRRLNLKARTETVRILNSRNKFVFALPQGFVVTKDKNHDFEVLRLEKVKTISDTNWLTLTIYLGFHPSYFHREYGFNKAEATKLSGHFLKQNVEWLYFEKPGKQFYLKEQEFPFDNVVRDMTVHVVMMGNLPGVIDDLTGIVDEIQLTTK